MWDIHCHILPGVDDGAEDMEMAKMLIRKELDDGVQNIILTPHYRRRMFEPEMSQIYSMYEQLRQETEDWDINLYLGCEYHANMDMAEDLNAGKRPTLSTTSDTRVVAISVTNSDPYLARDIANAIRSTAAAHIQAVMNTEAVNVVDEANIPSEKSGPKVKRDVLIAGFAGIVLALIVNFVLFLMNDKVTTAEDVERYLGLSVLAQMPFEMDEVKKKKARKKLEKKKKRRSSFKK